MVWGARFTNLFNPPRNGLLSIDIGRLHSFERAPLPEVDGEILGPRQLGGGDTLDGS